MSELYWEIYVLLLVTMKDVYLKLTFRTQEKRRSVVRNFIESHVFSSREAYLWYTFWKSLICYTFFTRSLFIEKMYLGLSQNLWFSLKKVPWISLQVYTLPVGTNSLVKIPQMQRLKFHMKNYEKPLEGLLLNTDLCVFSSIIELFLYPVHKLLGFMFPFPL